MKAEQGLDELVRWARTAGLPPGVARELVAALVELRGWHRPG